jgi:archaellum component FlaC
MEAMREGWTDDLLDDLNRRVEDGFKHVDERFEQIDRRFEQVDERFEQVDERFKQVEQRLDRVEVALRDLGMDTRATQRLFVQFAGATIVTLVVGFLGVITQL